MGFLQLRRQYQISHEVRRGAQLSKLKVKSILFNLLDVTFQTSIEILLFNIKKVDAFP